MTIETKKEVKTTYKMECKVNNFTMGYFDLLHGQVDLNEKLSLGKNNIKLDLVGLEPLPRN
jgi:hypothetical protein